MIINFTNYDFKSFIDSLGISFNDFNLSDDDFDHKSNIHGINHTYRVMFNCLKIGYLCKDIENTRRAFFSAYIHDTARANDGRCLVHGMNSIKYKLPLFQGLFKANGAKDEDIEAIKLAVTNHSDRFEIEKDNPYYKTVAILRDADGLDLIRINIKPNPNILRLPESRLLIDNAEKFFLKTDSNKYTGFTSFLKENL